MEFDYKDLGLKAGLECHQQLDTGKLYCHCPGELTEAKPEFLFHRKIRPTPSELGEYDKAALEAFSKNYTYSYESYNALNCLVELDEEPPQSINKKALDTVLEVALLADSSVLDEFQTMRKAIIDGSTVSGFQRTMLVSLGGKIKLLNKEIGIATIMLEEDASRTIAKTENGITYRIDRLGIPLIELATQPELHTPEEVKECALKIGELFRITGKAKRGIGTIRQDVNISIREGTRVE
ncbi:MAG: Glu-tRNA(Gln) amidotransferase GatDE subunit E, partial [Candidatus Diapherotrites archaeon]|nr:Glu-tRNA(Gln) amidotransferase GatDE subunit E [Candidatus Diapherotrites archaeon]